LWERRLLNSFKVRSSLSHLFELIRHSKT
jgi:hypothetical protein